MELVEASRDKERGTVVGHELLGRTYTIDFWQKMNVKRLRVKAKEAEKEAEIPIAKEVREETIAKPIAIKHVMIGMILIVLVIVAGIGIYSFHLESLKKPKFNVFDLKVIGDIAVYVQNIGSKDAHEVEVYEKAWWYHDEWLKLSLTTGYVKVLRVQEIYKFVMENNYRSGEPRGLEFKVVVTCLEGVTQEFFFK